MIFLLLYFKTCNSLLDYITRKVHIDILWGEKVTFWQADGRNRPIDRQAVCISDLR